MADPIRTLVAIFQSRQDLIEAVDQLVELELINVGRTAVIARAADGETVIVNNTISPNEAGVAGGTLGVLMGVLGVTQLGLAILPGVGPILSIGAGALVGGLLGRQTGRFAAHLLNLGFSEEQVEGLANRLQQGQAALVIEVSTEQDYGKIETTLRNLQADFIARVEDLSNPSLTE